MFTLDQLERVAVVGTSCSGKSTFAGQLSRQLGVGHIELDSLYWGPNWTPIDADQFRRRIVEETSQPSWVCDGNYSMVRDIVWRQATAAVWLNYSLPVVFGRALKRTFKRCLCKVPLYGDNRENFRKSFLSRDSILLWVLQTHGRHQREYPKQFADAAHAHLHVIELRGESEAQRFLGLVRHLVSDTSKTGPGRDG